MVRSDIYELEALLESKPILPGKEALAVKIREELGEASEKLGHHEHPGHLVGSHLTVAQIHVNTARALLLQAIPPDEVLPLLPGLVGVIREQLREDDPRRVHSEKILHDGTLDESKVQTILDAVGVSQLEALREHLRVGSFVRIVQVVTAGLAALAVTVGVLTAIWPWLVPLCFIPQNPPDSKKPYRVVCPVYSELVTSGPSFLPSENYTAVAQADYAVVEVAGVLAASISATSALRRINGTATPYPVPVSLALLKLPTGALTAVLGLLVMRGGFIPGLSALDSTAQIIAWALVFGYSQQLFTKFVDQQGQVILDAVRGPLSGDPKARGTTASGVDMAHT
ncbi:hypothetical protein GCM10011579_007760 [Streptomyces albiflavescens]|uniref:Uncharacterized protein n=1 Tax=Streptomyces albiflavescens TaxID=1623582 RepID=A0A918CZ56_9ACTN|nr:hypothetical protein GCM10011579_007760 [Streptomyces albiflavescens]